jgi:hypothetical protein
MNCSFYADIAKASLDEIYPTVHVKLTVRLIRNTCERGEIRFFGFRGATGIPMVNIVFVLSLSSFSFRS